MLYFMAEFGFWWVLDLWWLLAGFRVSWVSGFWVYPCWFGFRGVGGWGLAGWWVWFSSFEIGFEWMLVVGDFGWVLCGSLGLDSWVGLV